MANEFKTVQVIRVNVSADERQALASLEERRLDGEQVEGEIRELHSKIRQKNPDDNVISQFLATFSFVDRSVQRARMAICRACDHSRRLGPSLNDNASMIQCKKCNCLMNAKTRMTSASCPIGKF